MFNSQHPETNDASHASCLRNDLPTFISNFFCVRTAASQPQQLNLSTQPPQCQTSRLSMVSTGIRTYGSNGAVLLSRRLWMDGTVDLSRSVGIKSCQIGRMVLPSRPF